MRLLFFFVSCAAVVAACSSSSRSSFDGDSPAEKDAGAEAGPAASDASGPIFADAGSKDAASGSSCEREIAMGKLTISNPSCFVNEHVSNKTTKLAFACAGGAASATFAGHTFTGTVQGDVIALTNVEKFLFNNCQWESTEKIDGDLSKGSLFYSYTEKPVVSCPDTPCTASGTVAVSAGAVVVVN
jgi:hypothetical protein